MPAVCSSRAASASAPSAAKANAPTVTELADLGVARISVGGAFAFAALGALADAARELQTAGTYGFWRQAAAGRQAARAAFRP